MADQRIRVAVLFQALDSPEINGVRKPKKPGGYQDSAADIAYCLKSFSSVEVVTPIDDPSPDRHEEWCFGDDEAGLVSAMSKGATHLWANTVLFATHPLQTSPKVDEFANNVKVIGQPPLLVEQYDDKELVNNLLRRIGGFNMPKAWTIHDHHESLVTYMEDLSLPFPVVGKPIRGRGSHGVKVCHSLEELGSHISTLFKESSSVMVEEFLQGEEGTVTVMPPSEDKDGYWALPIVRRFNHQGGVAPYNGIVAVTKNSEAVLGDAATHSTYTEAARQCERAASLLKTTAPIRIDIRRYKDSPESKFALFDVNMKPNMTGPGRPGRDDQASLTLLAAQALGWDYSRLLQETLKTSKTIEELRLKKPDFSTNE